MNIDEYADKVQVLLDRHKKKVEDYRKKSLKNLEKELFELNKQYLTGDKEK